VALSRRPVVLALRASGLGDLLTVVPALRALRRAQPGSCLVVAAPGPLAPLAMATGAVDHVVPTSGLSQPIAATFDVDVAVNLHGRGPQSHVRLLELHPRRLLGFHHDAVPESAAMPRWIDGEHDVARWCRLLSEVGIPSDPGDLRVQPPAPDRGSIGADVVVHPGAGSPARRWPLDRWRDVVAALSSDGLRVVVTGSDVERVAALTVVQEAGLPDSHVAAGRTDVMALAALVAHARLVVCGDTGIGHLATALGTPAVHLFGPVRPSEWGPPDEPGHRVLWAGTTGDPHGLEVDPGLLAIEVDQVLVAARDLLGVPAGSSGGARSGVRRTGGVGR
jgi:ADP-heptose:LPS heptosyltransferase